MIEGRPRPSWFKLDNMILENHLDTYYSVFNHYIIVRYKYGFYTLFSFNLVQGEW